MSIPQQSRFAMRRFFLLTAKIAISGALLYFALRSVDTSTIAARLGQIQFGWLALAVAVALFQTCLGALRWREIAMDCGAPIGLSPALRYSLIGAFFNQTLPSTIGGDAVRLWLVARVAGWRAATYSVLVDRAVGLMALSTVIAVGLPWSYELVNSPSGRTALLALDAISISCALGFLIVGRLRWTWLRHWWLTRHAHACSVIANKVLFSPRRGPFVALLSLSIHVLAVVIALCVARAVAAPVTFFETFLLIPPITLIAMVPISIAGWGVREAAMMVAFSYAGLPQADGLLISVVFGVTLIIVGAIGGLVWILGGEKMPVKPPLAVITE